MALQHSTNVRNGVLDAWQTAIGNSAILRIYAGTIPASVGAAAGTLLVQYNLASTWAPAASGGTKQLNGLPLEANASAPGVATYFRLYASDGTTCHTQGTVSIINQGGDIIIDNTNIAINQVVRVVSFTVEAPGA